MTYCATCPRDDAPYMLIGSLLLCRHCSRALKYHLTAGSPPGSGEAAGADRSTSLAAPAAAISNPPDASEPPADGHRADRSLRSFTPRGVSNSGTPADGRGSSSAGVLRRAAKYTITSLTLAASGIQFASSSVASEGLLVMRSVFGNPEAVATEIQGRFRQGTDKNVGPSKFGIVAKALWPLKTAAHIAAIAGRDERTAARWLSGEFEPPGILLVAVLSEITKPKTG